MAKSIIDGTTSVGQQYPIRTYHINTEGLPWKAFDHSGTEISARWVIRLCQEKGEWLPFTQEQIDEFSGHSFHFNRLRESRTESDNFVQLRDGMYHVTHEFIVSYFRASPSTDVVPAEEAAAQ
jgi:hypothetical protein